MKLKRKRKALYEAKNLGKIYQDPIIDDDDV